MTRPNPTIRTLRRTSITACLLLLVACGDDAPPEQSEKQTGREPSVRQSSDQEPRSEDLRGWLGAGADAGAPAVLATREINQAFWFTGWKVTLGTATLAASEGNAWGTLTISAQFENLLDGSSRQFGDSWLDNELTLAAGGKFYEGSSDAPLLPAQRAGSGELVFSLPSSIDLESATLIVGIPKYAQAKVSLGPKGEGTVTLEPTVLVLDQSITSGGLTVHVKDVVVKANASDFQKESGTRRMVVHFSAELAANATYQNVGWNNFAVTQPDGRKTSAEIGGTTELLYPGDKLEGLWETFTVPEHFAGQYTVLVTDGNKAPPASLTFTLP